MNICNLGNKIKKRETPNDVVYTPKKLAELMISFCDIKENDLVLDCCKGAGVFYNNYPKNCLKEWCEITEDRDFFKDICNLSTCMRGKWQQVKGVRKKRGSNDCSNLNRKNIS